MRMPINAPKRSPRKDLRGLTLVEIIIATGIMAVLMLASAAAMGESVDSTTMSRELTQGAIFLESVQEDLSAVSTNDILALNGQRIFQSESASGSDYVVDITAFLASTDLVQLRLSLRDQRSGREVASVSSLRALV